MKYEVLFKNMPYIEKDGKPFTPDPINYPLKERVDVIIDGKYRATVKSFNKFEVDPITLNKIKKDGVVLLKIEELAPGSAVFSDSSGGLKHVGKGVYVSF